MCIRSPKRAYLNMESILTDTYSIHFNYDAYVALNQHLRKERYSNIFILVDQNTHQACLPIFLSSLETELDVEIIEIEAGEKKKKIETCI